MSKGRKPLPQEILNLRGTDRKDRQRPLVSVNGDIQLKDCNVTGLQSSNKRSREIYWRVCRRMKNLNILDREFLPQILMYAVQYDTYLTACEIIRKRGLIEASIDKDGNPISFPNPAVKIRDKSVEILLKIGSNFGMSPVDSQKIRVNAAEEKDKRVKSIMAMVEYDDDDEEVDDQ